MSAEERYAMIDVSQVKFDAAGLIPAVLVDDATNEVLMMAWMNADALAATLRTRLATFWSRSRREIWIKGSTSGHFMHVVSVTADCDADTLLLRVNADGPACHTGARSCFFQEVAGLGARLEKDFAPVAAGADYHMHTTDSDGDATPRKMVEAAYAAGLTRVGISDHSYVAFDPDYPLRPNRCGLYRAEIAGLREEFAGRVEVFCGLEQDYYSPRATGFDYLIGSVHYVRVPGKNMGTCVSPANPEGEFLPVDIDAETLALGIEKYFNGDAYALVEAYYGRVADVVNRTGCDIIGHFDLVKLFNGDGAFFDENNPHYIAAWQRAADVLLTTGVPFEINVNGVAKGACAEPYPSLAITRYLAERGARFVVSSDAHSPEALRRPDERLELTAYSFATLAK